MATLDDGWRDLPRQSRAELRTRLAVAAAKARLPVAARHPDGNYHTPGAMAVALDTKVVQRPHLQIIDAALASLRPDTGDALMILTPPQVGKSSRVSEWGVLWWLTRYPWHRVILGSYQAMLATDRSRAVRQLVRQHGAPYGLMIDPEHGKASDWRLSCGGGMRAFGMDTGITGTPADAVWIDDPHKDRAEADSPAMRRAVWDAYSGSINSRLAPRGPRIFVGTPWHPDDLRGRLLKEEGTVEEGGRWRVIRLPALADARDDPLGRPIGEPLSHPKIPVGDTAAALAHWKDKRDTSTPRDWGALYQCDPQPAEGALVTKELLEDQRDYQPDTNPRAVAVAVDPSGGGRDTAGVVAGWVGEDERLYVTHDRSGYMPSDQWSRAACELAREVGADRIVYESNYGGDMIRLIIRTAWDALSREAQEAAAEAVEAARAAGEEPSHEDTAVAATGWGLPPSVVPVHSKRGKYLRAEPIAQQFAEDRIRLAAYLPELELEWLSWRPASPDSPGRIDASVHLAYALLRVPGSAAVVSNPNRAARQTGRSALTRARR